MAHLLGAPAQTVPLFAWFKLVNDTVTEPYLDELFHVRQAQAYCNGDFDTWDPKITTPPGLYLLSSLLSPVIGCSLMKLRAINVYALVLTAVVITRTYWARQRGTTDDAVATHSSFNILLFPPLFFFSALYYTDVVSTLSVLVFYWCFLHAEARRWPLWFQGPLLALLGALCLLFRQTNIFWVALFPAGLVLVDRLDRGHQVVRDSMHSRTEGFGDSVLSVARTSYKMDVVYNLPVRDAWMEDYAKSVVSIVACGLKAVSQRDRIFGVLPALTPYITLICLVAGFVLWNGGVVLGDKSNHIATIHLPQMLYIWPYFTFFSWPLLYPYLLTVPLWLLAKMPSIAPLETALIFQRRQLLLRSWLAVLFIALACGVVHFNTIVHPFTLADNRHYTFYIFRLLMRPSWVKYAVTPIYTICGWACVQALGASPIVHGTSSREGNDDSVSEQQPAQSQRLPDGTTPAKTSFLLVWLATSALQLVTAPLVEPRYFILPWIFWRMHVPLQRHRAPDAGTEQGDVSWQASIANLDPRLLLETAWLLCVNAVTCYIFLTWTFGWPQEPGRLQRFMW